MLPSDDLSSAVPTHTDPASQGPPPNRVTCAGCGRSCPMPSRRAVLLPERRHREPGVNFGLSAPIDIRYRIRTHPLLRAGAAAAACVAEGPRRRRPALPRSPTIPPRSRSTGCAPPSSGEPARRVEQPARLAVIEFAGGTVLLNPANNVNYCRCPPRWRPSRRWGSDATAGQPAADNVDHGGQPVLGVQYAAMPVPVPA
jgi:hypothetical protein